MTKYLIIGIIILFTSCQKSKPIFRQVNKQITGIDFQNTIVASDSFNILNFHYLYNGGGVGVGDFNNDGLQDIFFGGNQVSCKLYLNQGGFKFIDISKDAGIETNQWINGISVIDINNDGLKDIYLSVGGFDCDGQCHNLLFINETKQNKVTFKEKAHEYGLDDGFYTQQTIFFDVDADGDLDAYLLQNYIDPTNKNYPKPQKYLSSKSFDKLLINQSKDSLGHAFFEDKSAEWGVNKAGYGLGVSLLDANQDYCPDLYIANDFISSDHFFINKNGKYFEDKIQKLMSHTSYNSMGVDIKDLNHDGNEEIFVVDMLPQKNSRQKSMLGKMNYDKLGLATSEGYEPQFVKNTLQKNNGMIGDSLLPFSEISYFCGLANTDWSWSPLIADFTNDGQNDIFITNGYGKDITDLDFISYNSSTQEGFQTQENYNRTAYENIKKQPSVLLQNQFFEGKIDFGFDNNTEKYFAENPSLSNGAAYCDLDNDGDLDLITNNINEPAFVFENTISNKSFIKIHLTGSKNNIDAVGTTIRLWVGKKMYYQYFCPVRGYLSSVDPNTHFGLGNAQKIDSLEIIWADKKTEILRNIVPNQLININYDDNLSESKPQLVSNKTLFTEYQNSPNLLNHHENPFTDYAYQPLLYRQYSTNCIQLKSAQISKNVALIFLASPMGFEPEIWWMKNDKPFKKQKLPKQSADIVDAAFFDIDFDGDYDLVVVHAGFELPQGDKGFQAAIFLNKNGHFEYLPSSQNFPKMASSSLAIADFDKNGSQDILLAGGVSSRKFPENDPTFLYSFSKNGLINCDIKCPELKKIGMVSDAVWADLDQDGWVDLVVVGEWNTIKIFKNNKGFLKLVQHNSLENIKGLWRSVAIIDANKDGLPDILVGNIGNNTKLQASDQKPLILFNGDLDQNSSLDPIIGFYLNDDKNQLKLFPYHTRDDIMTQVPALKKTFQNYSEFGKSTFDEIIMKFNVTEPKLLLCNTTASGIFINNGKMGLEFSPLPATCQFAPTNDILVGDFNDDDNQDFILAQNDYSTETNGGWQVGSLGVVALGDGKGKFKILPNNISGLILNTEAKSLTFFNNKHLWVGNTKERLIKYELNKMTNEIYSHNRPRHK
jgi:enediyne biosynthesis protein E4